MKTITVYNFDTAGFYTGSSDADESPMEPGVFLMPANSTTVKPPQAPAGKRARWNGGVWKLTVVTLDDRQVALVKLQDFLNNNPDVAAIVAGN